MMQGDLLLLNAESCPVHEAMWWRCCGAAVEIFFLGGLCVFAGVFGKTDGKTWCFGGEFVVLCVVSVVLEQPYLQGREM
jgi:hypothetical protein